MPYYQTKDGCYLYFEIHSNVKTKKEPSIVFLNGFIQTTLYWKYHVRKFKDAYQVVTYDARAQGKSDLGILPLTLEQHVKDLAGLLNFLKIKTVHLIGISFGARIALEFTKKYCHKTVSLVLCSIAMQRCSYAVQIFLAAEKILFQSGIENMAEYLLPFLLGNYFSMKEQKIKKAITKAIAKRNKKESLLEQIKAMKTYPDISEMSLLSKVPSILVIGAEDQLITRHKALKLRKHIDSEWSLIQGAGHSVPIENPDIFYNSAKEFIESCDS